ncbi:calcium-translocating P-type ATPase, PMCA-type [Fusarium oxysporum f. sp. conglutinans race 2 54008]|uniref:Calcium-translocating P-type ATPase, PMCA-type n=2 Tax=Fusarium oxysporum TaxID=5507 RepID=X0KFR9_FUSOX|nr:calcium-translocating P-type ATPase, PMCA-type [Fusarium oxysporum f. sp. conglutinans race 2 54008]EXM12328.1 calcium-translocating P-type ATPase, PMCA-type [Fusarium oxysporum f. sp. vasinfectum 25433]
MRLLVFRINRVILRLLIGLKELRFSALFSSLWLLLRITIGRRRRRL